MYPPDDDRMQAKGRQRQDKTLGAGDHQQQQQQQQQQKKQQEEEEEQPVVPWETNEAKRSIKTLENMGARVRWLHASRSSAMSCNLKECFQCVVVCPSEFLVTQQW
jgi:ferredoxin